MMAQRRPTPRTYRRPMAGWWRRNPLFRSYMLREASALFLVAYALVLLVGLLRLVQGEAAYAHWRAALGSPWAIAWHVAALGMVSYHSLTWFQVMPKTLPRLAVPAAWITAAGLALTACLSLAALAGLRWLLA